jgi:hypothetical protein
MGRTSAKNVEVIISEVERGDKGRFSLISNFLADNLEWSAIDKPNCNAIPPGIYKSCKLGRIDAPGHREDEKKPFCFEVNFKSNIRYYLVEPGTYRFTITVGCDNAKSIRKRFEMQVKDYWSEVEAEMLKNGSQIKEV